MIFVWQCLGGHMGSESSISSYSWVSMPVHLCLLAYCEENIGFCNISGYFSMGCLQSSFFQHQKYCLIFLPPLEHDIFVGQPGEGSWNIWKSGNKLTGSTLLVLGISWFPLYFWVAGMFLMLSSFSGSGWIHFWWYQMTEVLGVPFHEITLGSFELEPCCF